MARQASGKPVVAAFSACRPRSAERKQCGNGGEPAGDLLREPDGTDPLFDDYP
jgi:hypothetical protein